MIKSNKLLIVTGPSNAGKSVLIDRILRGECQKLCNQLKLGNPSNWQLIQGKNINRNKKQFIDYLILHKGFNSKSKNHNFKIVHEFIRRSEDVTVLTMCPPANIVFWRTIEEMKTNTDLQIQNLMKLRNLRKLGKRLKKLWHYCNQGNMLVGYERWFSYLEKNGIERSWLINCTSSNVDKAIPFSFESYMLLVKDKHMQK